MHLSDGLNLYTQTSICKFSIQQSRASSIGCPFHRYSHDLNEVMLVTLSGERVKRRLKFNHSFV